MVSKAYPEEKVGVFALREGQNVVVEYSELDPEEACATHPGTHYLSAVSCSCQDHSSDAFQSLTFCITSGFHSPWGSYWS